MTNSKKRLYPIKRAKLPPVPEEKGEEGGERLLTFEEALAKYLDSLYSTAVRLTKDREKAKDLVQEASLRAFKNFSQLRSGTRAKAWLFSILMNTFINEYRKKSKEPPIVDIYIEEIFDHSILSYSQNLSEEEFFDKILDDEVKKALDTLPIDFREVIWLSDVEGFSQKEIAEMISCPMGTVASRLYRGRRLLKENLMEYARKRGIVGD